MYICDDCFCCFGLTFYQNFDVQLLRNFCKLYFNSFVFYHIACLLNLFCRKTVDYLQLFFRFCYDCADGNSIFDADQIGARDTSGISIFNDVSACKGVDVFYFFAQMCSSSCSSQSQCARLGASCCQYQTIVQNRSNRFVVHFGYPLLMIFT